MMIDNPSPSAPRGPHRIFCNGFCRSNSDAECSKRIVVLPMIACKSGWRAYTVTIRYRPATTPGSRDGSSTGPQTATVMADQLHEQASPRSSGTVATGTGVDLAGDYRDHHDVCRVYG